MRHPEESHPQVRGRQELWRTLSAAGHGVHMSKSVHRAYNSSAHLRVASATATIYHHCCSMGEIQIPVLFAPLLGVGVVLVHAAKSEPDRDVHSSVPEAGRKPAPPKDPPPPPAPLSTSPPPPHPHSAAEFSGEGASSQ